MHALHFSLYRCISHSIMLWYQLINFTQTCILIIFSTCVYFRSVNMTSYLIRGVLVGHILGYVV